MKPIKVEIVTPVHNRRDETLECLRSIAQADKNGLDIHVVVVDDGSTDGTAEILADNFPEVQIVRGDGNLWYTAGANLAIKTALGHDPDYILLINNDQVFDANCIAALVACSERQPRSIVGAVLLDREHPEEVFQVSPKWDTLKGGFRHWFKQSISTIPDKPWRVEIIVGNCVLFPAAAIREQGLMDEKRLPQFGDAEYTPRMRRAGWQLLIEPKARVFCKPNDVIRGFKRLPFGEKIKRLFASPTDPYSIQRRFYASLGGAPNKITGLAAFTISIFRILIGRSYESSWAKTLDEPPLVETFADAMVDK